jgi:membrane protein DedA with SNARE-associated domain/rhodanese-related sulfurtransferase
MSPTTDFLVKHGAPVLLGVVFVEQMGLPLPAIPWMLAAGALAAAGNFNLPLGIALVVLACLVADLFWFYLGRYHGRQVMGFLCRIVIEPDSCVRRTENMFTRYGLWGVLVAKFVPGLSTMAPPLAGMSGVKAVRFAAVDTIGALLFGACFLGLGFIFKNQVEKVGALLVQIGGNAIIVLAGLAALYVGYKFLRRRLVLRELRMARITAEELRQKQTAGESLVILDLRSRAELEQEPEVILGAVHLLAGEVDKWSGEFPRDREVIVYCSCPNEVTAARVALTLRKKGFKHIRPLRGGINEWRKNNYPLQQRNATAAAPSAAAPAQASG